MLGEDGKESVWVERDGCVGVLGVRMGVQRCGWGSRVILWVKDVVVVMVVVRLW